MRSAHRRTSVPLCLCGAFCDLRPPERLALEGVVFVRAATAQEDERAGEQVGGEEERAPAFALANVDALVVARQLEQVGVTPEDNMTKGHCAGAALQQRAVGEEPSDEPAVNLQNAADDLMTDAADGGREYEGEEADGGGRERPKIG